MIAVFALLASSVLYVQGDEKFQQQYVDERLRNDSLMGAMQNMQKQIWEKEQELMKKDSLIDSITEACNYSSAELSKIEINH
ncbi:hypothetical protein WJR50_28500 [Catalinimonas sp. 4WD22]|uniref:hypothetical protein n=1 Tax=Catalinimonas locisalis TaxID=3133978 RepID=UPI003100AE17